MEQPSKGPTFGPSPFLKWAGGKRQLIPAIMSHLPNDIQNLKYFEPFIGGGALLFHLQPTNAVINDYNQELINVYNTIKNNLKALLADLRKHQNTSEYFYFMRSLDRGPNFSNLSDIERASRIIYLNKTCYNGLYRVNSNGHFNSPFGHYKNPNIVNEDGLKATCHFLNNNNIVIKSGDYKNILESMTPNSFVYLDPPYHPLSPSSNFTSYIQGGWSELEQIELKNTCDFLNEIGVKFLLSNSNTPLIRELYKSYNINTVKAKRAINSNPSGRGEILELLIKNYE